jgi:endonuclease III
LSRRLGLVPEDTDARKAHILLQESVPENLVYSLHLNLIQHGRRVCQAQNPGCGECVVYDLCVYEEKKNHIKRGELTYAQGKYLRGGKKDKKALHAPTH